MRDEGKRDMFKVNYWEVVYTALCVAKLKLEVAPVIVGGPPSILVIVGKTANFFSSLHSSSA